jgi:hypothetical protein
MIELKFVSLNQKEHFIRDNDLSSWSPDDSVASLSVVFVALFEKYESSSAQKYSQSSGAASFAVFWTDYII